MSQTGCPSRDQIRGYVLGELSDAEIQAFDRHIGQCEICRALAEALGSAEDDLLKLVGGAFREGVYLEESECQEAVAQAAGIAPAGGTRGGDAAETPPGSATGNGADTGAAFAAATVSDVDLRGRRFGRFELSEVIGRGSYGTVYRARDPRLDRDVALKVPRAEVLADRRDEQRFLREGRAAAQLRHPHIVPVHEAGEVQNTYYIASDFIEGTTLHEKLQSGWRPAHREAAQVIAKLASALHYAHTRGIVHRDVKPANVILDDTGDPHLTDFGLARREEPDATHTQEGARMGTPAYMSPEQAAGESHLADARSDLWSLGVTFYEMLAGARPFAGQGVDLYIAIKEKDPDSPRKHDRSIAKDLETICLKCLAKQPDHRYPSCRHLADELERWLRGEPIEARPVGSAERFARWCRRNPALAGLGAAVAFSLLGGTIVSTYFAIQSRRQAATATALADQARRNAELATQNAQQARGQEKLATERAREVAEALEQAHKSHETTRRYLYAAQMSQVLDRWAEKDIAGVQQLLETLRPGPGEEDLRGFEWHYYWRLVHGYRLSFGTEDDPCFDAVFSEDGKTLITSGHAVTFWNAETGAKLRSVAAEPGRAYDLWRADDGRLLVYSVEPTLRVWRLEGDRFEPLYDGGQSTGQWHVRFSHDGRRLAVADCTEQKTHFFHVVDLQTGKALFTVTEPEERIRPLAFSPDDKLLAVGTSWSWHGGDVLLWDATTGQEKVKLAGHISSPLSAAFAPDGKRLASSDLPSIKMWDVTSGEPLGDFPGAGGASLLAFSPDGETLAGASAGGHPVALWHVETRREVNVMWGHTDDVSQVRFSPDGKTLATASRDGTVKLWDVAARQVDEVRTSAWGREGAIRDLAVSPDGGLVATAGADGTARLWSLPECRPQATCHGHVNGVNAVVFSPDGKMLVTGSDDKSIRLWDAGSGQPQRVLWDTAAVLSLAISSNGHVLVAGEVGEGVKMWDLTTGRRHALEQTKAGWLTARSVALSPDEQIVAAGCDDATVRLWDATTAKELVILRGHGTAGYTGARPVESVAFSPDGKVLASTGVDQTVRLWDVAARKPLSALREGSVTLFSLDFSPDGKTLVAAGGDSMMRGIVRQWDLSGGVDAVRSLGGARAHEQRSAIRAVFAPGASRLLSGSNGGSIGLWEKDNKGAFQYLSKSAGHADAAMCVAFSPDGAKVAIGKRDFTVEILDAATGKRLQHLAGHADAVKCAAFSPDGRLLATGSWDQGTKLWDAVTGRELRNLDTPPQGMANGTEALAFSHDGSTLAVATARHVRLINLESFEVRRQFQEHDWTVLSLAFSSDDRLLACGGGGWWPVSESELKIWDTRTGELFRQFHTALGPVQALRFLEQNRILLSAGLGRKVQLWDVERAKETSALPGTRSAADRVAVSPDGQILATATGGRVLLWDLSTGRQRAGLLGPSHRITCLGFSPDGQTLASGGSDGSIHFWRTQAGGRLGETLGHPVAVTPSSPGFAASPRHELARMRGRFASRLNAEKRYAECQKAYASTVATYEQLLCDAPRSKQYRHELAEVYRRQAVRSIQRESYEAGLDSAHKAVQLLEDLTDERPDHAGYRKSLIDAYCAEGILLTLHLQDVEGAAELIRRAVSLNEQSLHQGDSVDDQRYLAHLYYRLAARMKRLGKLEESADLLRRCLATYAGLRHRPATFGIATWREDYGTWQDRALSLLAGLISTDGSKNQPQTYHSVVRTWADLAERFPDEPVYRYQLARAHVFYAIGLMRADRPEKAAVAVGRCIAVQRNVVQEYPRVARYREALAGTLRWRASLLEKQEAFSEAIADSEEALRLEPENADNAFNLAYLLAVCPHADLRDPPRAARLAEEFVRSDPKAPAGWQLLGIARYRDGQWQGAVEALEKTLTFAGRNKECVRLFLAMALWQLGRKDEAQKQYIEASARSKQREEPPSSLTQEAITEAQALLESSGPENPGKP